MEVIPNKIVSAFGFAPVVLLKRNGKKEFIETKIKPQNSPVSIRGRYLTRAGSTNHELKGAQLQNFLLEKSDGSWESAIEERATLKDIDERTLEHFKVLSEKRFPLALKEKSVSSLLEKLNLLNKGKLTRAAILLFGKEPQRFYNDSRIRIGRFKDDATLLGEDEITGNLFQQVENAMDILKKKYLHSEVGFEGLHRKEELEYPEEALREAIVNAIVHRDYSSNDSQFRIYSHQISLWNPGGLVGLTIDDLKKKHGSYRRNQLIAEVFHKAGFVEKWGTGTVKMVQECRDAGLPEPIYEESQDGMQVTFFKDIYNEGQLQKMGLNERQIVAVLHLREKGKLTNNIYQKICNTSERTATRDLSDLVSKKLLFQSGKTGKGTEYTLSRHKAAKAAIKTPRSRQEGLDKKLSLLDKELNVIDPDEEVKQQFDKDYFFTIYDSWLSDLFREFIPVIQKFNRYFKKPSHNISITNVGWTQFKNEGANGIISNLRKECEKNKEKIQSHHSGVKISATYRSFIKGGLKSFGCHYEMEIKFYDDWYEIYMDDESQKRNHNLQLKNLYHKTPSKTYLRELAEKFGETIYGHITIEFDQIKNRKKEL